MATNEEIDRFVSENREMIERMMAIQEEGIRTTAELGRQLTEEAIKVSVMMADIMMKKTEEFVKATFEMLTSPEVQKHFMTAGMETLAGVSAMAELAPMPGFVKTGVLDTERAVRQAACIANPACSARSGKNQVKDSEESAA